MKIPKIEKQNDLLVFCRLSPNVTVWYSGDLYKGLIPVAFRVKQEIYISKNAGVVEKNDMTNRAAAGSYSCRLIDQPTFETTFEFLSS